jgi:hypothetical protein
MRNEFYEIYKDLYDFYRRAFIYPRILPDIPFISQFYYFDIRSIRWVTDAIEFAVSTLGLTERIRPDAKHFLLVNFHQMVVLPLAHPEAEGIGPPPPELEQILRDDSMNILSTAVEGSREGEITASDILKTISDLWDRLGMSQFRIWG